ncbi:hypothetical protein [Sphaerimonospora thailandensis]|uniref:hypothetical protein n=1 Tax=Sphaerimonospora thailandensis TaxID=795644 RepID=UPI0019502212|nr:hypothetical protein [Sphaerimonospora thailandensis]
METLIRAILTGEKDQLGQIPAADVAKLILGLQQALAAAASTVVRQRRKGVTGRHPAAIEAASRLAFRGVEPGSVQTLFALPDLGADADGDSFEFGDIPDLAQLAFDRLVRSFSSSDPDPTLARAIAKLGDELNVGSGGRTLRLVSGNGMSSGILDHSVRVRMNRYIRKQPVQRDDVLVGSLVEADFERHTARLQPAAGPPVQVTFPEEMADAVQECLRRITEFTGNVTFDPGSLVALKIELDRLSAADPLELEIESDSFWHHQTVDQLAREQGVRGPQRIEDLHTDLKLTSEEIEAFFAVVDE